MSRCLESNFDQTINQVFSIADVSFLVDSFFRVIFSTFLSGFFFNFFV